MPAHSPAAAGAAALTPATTPARAVEAARAVAGAASARAASLDHDGAFPAEDVAALASAGLLHAPLPAQAGGCGLGVAPATALDLAAVLRRLGGGSLPLARLYEGHVNAVKLCAAYGAPHHLGALRAEADSGRLSGVWNAGPPGSLRLAGAGDGLHLDGFKIYASGAGHVRRPLVTALPEGGEPVMVLARLDGRPRADLSRWTAQGMRASATGTVDLAGLPVAGSDLVGGPGDYYRPPLFAGGAWRFLAAQLGAMEALFGHLARHLARTGRDGDPHQRARAAEAAAALQTARLWVRSAALTAEDPATAPERAAAYVNLARGAVERAALDLLEQVSRSVGLAAHLRPDPVERIARDLATYLRQPFPDAARDAAAAHLLDPALDPHGDWDLAP